MIGFKHLQAFTVVARERSFTRAAEILFQTQPALSKQVKDLERYLDAILLDRQNKEVTLTEAGELFYPEARRILEGMERSREALAELRNLTKGRILLGASTLPGEYILPEYIGEFRKMYPGLKIELKIDDTGHTVQRLKAREIQIGLIGALPGDPELSITPCIKDELILIAPLAGHPDRYALAQLPWEMMIYREPGSGTRRVVEQFLAALGISPAKAFAGMEIGSTKAIINAVAAGLGISFVSRWAVQDALALGKVKEIRLDCGTIRRWIYLAELKGRYASPAVKTFREYIMAKATGRFNF